VSLAGSKVLLGTSEPQFLALEARPFRGAGVEFHVDVPWGEIEAIHLAHQAVDPSASPLEDRPWGERAFHATLGGYRFLIASPLSDGVAADPTALRSRVGHPLLRIDRDPFGHLGGGHVVSMTRRAHDNTHLHTACRSQCEQNEIYI
jgi:hypothetical protein